MELLKAREIEKRIPGLKAGTLWRMRKAGLIPSVRVGEKKKGIRFELDAVMAALRK